MPVASRGNVSSKPTPPCISARELRPKSLRAFLVEDETKVETTPKMPEVCFRLDVEVGAWAVGRAVERSKVTT